MKVAVTSVGTDIDSGIDGRFGRARYFVIVDTETDEILEVIDNLQQQHASHGAGVQAAQSVAESGAEWLLTENVGPKAFDVLSAAGVKIGNGASGTVRDAIEKFKTGGFEDTSQPTNPSHMR